MAFFIRVRAHKRKTKKGKIINVRGHTRVLKVMRIHKVKGVHYDVPKDRKKKALRPGKRISENGNIYYETRFNRADTNPKRRL